METNDQGIATTWITIDECHSPNIPVKSSSATLQIENEQEQEQSATNEISTLTQGSTHDPTQDLHICRKRNRASSENSPNQSSSTISKKYRTDTLLTDSNLDLNEHENQSNLCYSTVRIGDTTRDRDVDPHERADVGI